MIISDLEPILVLDVKVLNFYVMKEDGRPIMHKTFSEAAMDEALISSFLAAIKAFAGEALPSDRPLQGIDKGDVHIILANFKDLVGAIVIKTSRKEELTEAREVLKKTLKQIRLRFSSVLDSWDGNLTHFRELEPMIEKALQQLQLEPISELLSRSQLIRGADDYFLSITHRQYQLFENFWAQSSSFKFFVEGIGIKEELIKGIIKELLGERINISSLYKKFEIPPPKIITVIRHLLLRGILNVYTSV